MRRRGGRPTGERGVLGQALVEFALVAPIMLLIFAGLVQFAFIFERQIGIENAVRDGARRAATYSTNSYSDACTNGAFIWNVVFGSGGTMQTNVQGYDTSGTAVLNPLVTYTTQTGSAGFKTVLVQISVTYKHPLFLPLITQIIDGIDGHTDNALWVSTSSQFTVQNDATADASVGGVPVVYPGC
jgi:Flp pilus assembly protein TadG